MELRNLWLAALAVASTVVAHSQLAINPGTALQGPDHYSFIVGDVKITALSDGIRTGFEWFQSAYGNREAGSESTFADPHKNRDEH